jgi:hypothetical protein
VGGTLRMSKLCVFILVPGPQNSFFFLKEGKDEGFLDGLGVLLEC